MRGADFYLIQSVQSMERPAALLADRTTGLRVFFDSPAADVADFIPAVRLHVTDSTGALIGTIKSGRGARCGFPEHADR